MKAVVLVMESWASEMAFRIRFLLACLPGGREGLEGHGLTFTFCPHVVRHYCSMRVIRMVIDPGGCVRVTHLRSGLEGRDTRLDMLLPP